jgi:CheY-like chemotaxis protein/HAMP domain-containing protein
LYCLKEIAVNMFADWSLSRKLLSAFSVVLIFNVLALVLALWHVTRLTERLDYMIDVRVEAVKIAARLNRGIVELRSREKDALLADSAAMRNSARESINEIQILFEQRLDAINDLELSQDSQDILIRLGADYKLYSHALTRVLDLVKEDKSEQASELSRSDGEQLSSRARDHSVRFNDIQEQELLTTREIVRRNSQRTFMMALALAAAAVVLGLLISLLVGRSIGTGLARLVSLSNAIADGNLETLVQAQGNDEVGLLTRSLASMQSALREARSEEARREWLMTGLARLNDVVLGELGPEMLAQRVVSEMCEYLEARVGAMYLTGQEQETDILRLFGSYAYTPRKHLSNRWKPGEGLVGQAFLEQRQIMLGEVPDDYVQIVSGLGAAPPRNICVTPFLYEGRVQGVIEIGTLQALDGEALEYLKQAAGIVATAFEMANNRSQLSLQQEELKASNHELQEQARSLQTAQEELEARQDELQSTNAELETQMLRIKESEERLRVQQEEMEVVNEELHEKNALLERQKHETEAARKDIARQAEELATASKYKSEFLANMSHELRTPLNSLLLLARSLKENSEGNLSDDQIESAEVIFDSGSDLLNLINEILDLAKIEAGRVDLKLEKLPLSELVQSTRQQFDHMARNQGLELKIELQDDAPEEIVSDPARLRQVIKNLVGNALKFTEQGSVTVNFASVPEDAQLSRSGLEAQSAFVIQVIDTGIGIPLDKQRVVFEAFQQGDSGDRRRYGGTGLGLSISRDLSDLLGGEIQLISEPGKGSTFSLFLPRVATPRDDHKKEAEVKTPPASSATTQVSPSTASPSPAAAAAAPAVSVIDDDRNSLSKTDRSILVIEDDARFAKILVNNIHKRGFKCLAAVTGEEGLELARHHRPSGIVLDIHLPNMDGWAVLSSLKDDINTRHIPVHIVSAEEPSNAGLRIGAIGHVNKPLQKEDIESVLNRLEKASAHAEKRVLVVEDDPVMRKETVKIIGNGNVFVDEAESGEQALAALRRESYALVVLDLGLPDIQGLDLLKAISDEIDELPPVIVYTVRSLTVEEEMALRQYADSIILKDVRSQDRLLDEVALFLHRVVSDLPEDKGQIIRHLHESDDILSGKNVLVVEDDMRTMFAMAKILAAHKANPLKAENGEKALALLDKQPDVDLILMDMMMPVMDGYETVRRIREQPQFGDMPIIALTAKAMKEDRQKCIDAGASDYLPKPVDQDRLIALMRVWLCR